MIKPRDKSSRRRFRWLPLAISISLLALLAWKAEMRLQVMWTHFYQVNWGILAFALAFSAFWHLGMSADKWWRILRALGAPVGYWTVVRIRVGADPVRFAAPMQIGAVISAVYFGRMESLGLARAAGSVLFDKALNVFGAVFWLYVGLAAIAHVPVTWELAIHTAIGGAVLLLIGSRWASRTMLIVAEKLHPKAGRVVGGVLSVFEEFSLIKKVGFLLYGIVFQMRPLIVCAMLFVAFQPKPAALPTSRQFLAYGSVVEVVSNVPSMGGIGPREAALIQMFDGFADYQTLLTVGLTLSFALQIFPAILGIPWMFPLLRAVIRGHPQPQQEEPSGEAGCSTER